MTSDKLLNSPSKFPFICLWNKRRMWHYIKSHLGPYSTHPFKWGPGLLKSVPLHHCISSFPFLFLEMVSLIKSVEYKTKISSCRLLAHFESVDYSITNILKMFQKPAVFSPKNNISPWFLLDVLFLYLKIVDFFLWDTNFKQINKRQIFYMILDDFLDHWNLLVKSKTVMIVTPANDHFIDCSQFEPTHQNN